MADLLLEGKRLLFISVVFAKFDYICICWGSKRNGGARRIGGRWRILISCDLLREANLIRAKGASELLQLRNHFKMCLQLEPFTSGAHICS